MEQITNLAKNNPRSIIGDLNELSRPNENASVNKGKPRRYNNFNKCIQDNYLIGLG